MGEHCCTVEDGGEFVAGEGLAEQRLVTKVALNALEVFVPVGVGDEIEVDAAEAFGEKAALENSTEEAGASGDQDFLHVWSLNFLLRRKQARQYVS